MCVLLDWPVILPNVFFVVFLFVIGGIATIYFDPRIGIYPAYTRIHWDDSKKLYKCRTKVVFKATGIGSGYLTMSDDKLLVNEAINMIDPKYNNWISGKGIYIGGEITHDPILVGREDHNYFTAEIYFDDPIRDRERFMEYVKIVKSFENWMIKAEYINPFTGDTVHIKRAFIPEGYSQDLIRDFEKVI